MNFVFPLPVGEEESLMTFDLPSLHESATLSDQWVMTQESAQFTTHSLNQSYNNKMAKALLKIAITRGRFQRFKCTSQASIEKLSLCNDIHHAWLWIATLHVNSLWPYLPLWILRIIMILIKHLNLATIALIVDLLLSPLSIFTHVMNYKAVFITEWGDTVPFFFCFYNSGTKWCIHLI